MLCLYPQLFDSISVIHIKFNFSYPYQYQGWGSASQNEWNRGRWNGEQDSPFVKSAEASVKDAFASIESIVTAFTSVSCSTE